MKKYSKENKELISSNYNFAIPHLHASVNEFNSISNELPRAKTVAIKELYAGIYPTNKFYKPISTIYIDQ